MDGAAARAARCMLRAGSVCSGCCVLCSPSGGLRSTRLGTQALGNALHDGHGAVGTLACGVPEGGTLRRNLRNICGVEVPEGSCLLTFPHLEGRTAPVHAAYACPNPAAWCSWCSWCSWCLVHGERTHCGDVSWAALQGARFHPQAACGLHRRPCEAVHRGHHRWVGGPKGAKGCTEVTTGGWSQGRTEVTTGGWAPRVHRGQHRWGPRAPKGAQRSLAYGRATPGTAKLFGRAAA